MPFENEKITVLYGSQTGNAQDLAERIWRESKRYYFLSSVKPLDDYNIVNLVNETCVIIVCSTTGEGDEPDNMKKFWRFLLRKNLSPNSLSNLRFAVFGLGDSSYTKYNFAAKRLYKRLLQLGANQLLPIGLGDDQHDLGYDAEADPWIEKLWNTLLQLYPLPSTVQPLPKNYKVEPRWKIFSCINNESKLNIRRKSIYSVIKKPNDFTARIIQNKRITASNHFQDVRLIKLKCENQQYSPGDVVVLRPRNLKWKIQEFYDVLTTNGVKITPETKITVEQNDPTMTVPEVLTQEVTFEELCSEYFDLMSIPRRYTFQILAQLTDSELEKEKCLEFTTAEGQQDLYSYTYRPKRNIVEVLQDFPHATKNLNLEILLEIIPPIKPREFSIASSCRAHVKEIHVLLAVVKYKTKLAKERYGLGSNFLAGLKEGDEITGWVKKGSFKFSSDPNIPVIMVGPGTGVAPFRSYIFERCLEDDSNEKNLFLFFGSRYKDKDYLCKEDFEDISNKQKLNLITAFSREQDEKVYVQDKIKENKHLVWDALKQNAHIFVAGSAKNMPKDVRRAFVEVCQECGNMAEEEANMYIGKLEKNGRYQTECWS
ncbi:NADPH-dependent diflavin oxidoreductase 1 isoform X1 [Diorhabda sublineata]|uniref:NADPH-dependent diflavin oxidoreductase 1 isoform X1 n=2 Tax=Diorhabda sublineata TaxID=1163346 RepID=UPI0024E15FC3|nr:NADPH-dependent diflavin oxidoreductase 1 isoform X1 [Diorhabda sublineata]XP_056647645.1 NADPH-dependent diflavin oxidoreductase 1 isoform X1 [Diorhabda sublineata]XP_056647646.1 NADPH-dependent diflavin oxidoreductase 1 isoform X1 [Diorhabda sublineata]